MPPSVEDERPPSEAEQRKAALRGSQQRMGAYVQAWLDYVRHLTQPALLVEFIEHRRAVAQASAGGRSVSRRARDSYHDEARALALEHGPAIVQAAERLSSRDLLLAVEWSKRQMIEDPTPDALVRVSASRQTQRKSPESAPEPTTRPLAGITV